MAYNFERMHNLKLEIYHSAYVDLDHRWQHRNVCNDFTRLYFVRSGEGFLRHEGQTIKLQPGYMYLVPSNFRFDYGCTQLLSKLYFHVILTASDGLDLLSAIGKICRIPYPVEMLDKLMLCIESGNYTDLLYAKTCLYHSILTCLQQYSVTLPLREYSPLVQRAMDYIRNNLSIQLSTSQIANVFFVSESKLRTHFRKETGISIGKYIDKLVFIKAKHLLMDKTLPISQISQMLGFGDQFYFSRRFREFFRQTPSGFRKDNAEIW